MILILGDIHGRYDNLKHQIKTKRLSNCSIIQVGDFGAGITFLDLSEFNKELNDLNINMYVIRGNHDDPDYFKGNHIFSNLKFLPDYTQLEVEGHNVLFVGGATSVDRKINLAKMEISAACGHKRPLYWTDEVFVLDEEKIKNITGVDMVITHTAPEWCHPNNSGIKVNDFVLGFAENDKTLIAELKAERKLLNRLFQILKNNGNRIEKHYYGHFHRSEITLNGGTEHTLVGVDEFVIVDRYTDEEYEKIFT